MVNNEAETTTAADSAAVMSLPEKLAKRAAGGLPVFALSELPEPPGSLAPGDHVRLAGPDGSPLGFGLYDPDNSVLRVLPAHPDESLDDRFIHDRVATALDLRKRLGLVDSHSAYRLINGEGDELSGFLVDIYAGHAVIYSYSEGLSRYARPIASAMEALMNLQSVVAKTRSPGPAASGRVDATLLAGSQPPRQLQVMENGVRYEVHLLGGINTGLFVDMRDVRRKFRTLVNGQRVLNLFAYTGSFSVVAALGGAKTVTSVEYATGVVHWSKANFELNDLSPSDRRLKFIKGDVFEFLKSARRKDALYDTVVVDPPATTAVRGRRWFMKSDYDRLLGHVLRVLAPGGMLVVAASSFDSRPEHVESQIRAAARDHHRRLRLIQSFGLPPDFPTQMIHPQGRYLKCYFLLAD